MLVLDIGSGMGDVSLLADDMVGPGGRVLGIDRDAAALEHGRRRAAEQGCSAIRWQKSAKKVIRDRGDCYILSKAGGPKRKSRAIS